MRSVYEAVEASVEAVDIWSIFEAVEASFEAVDALGDLVDAVAAAGGRIDGDSNAHFAQN